MVTQPIESVHSKGFAAGAQAAKTMPNTISNDTILKIRLLIFLLQEIDKICFYFFYCYVAR
jgi:hypothetical protein